MKITVQADDLGLSDGATRVLSGIHCDGRLDRAGLLPNGPAFALAVSALQENRRLGCSVHLNLVEGRPLCHRQCIPLLVDRQGFFRHTFLSLWLLYRLAPGKRPRLLAQIESEVDAQIHRVREALPAQRLTLDSHQHVHLLPFVFQMLLRRSESWGVQRIRLAGEPFLLPPATLQGLAILFSTGVLKHLVLRLLSRRCRRLLRGSGIESPDYLVGVLFSGRMSLPVVRRALRRIAARNPGRNPEVELVFHPAPLARSELSRWRTSSRSTRFYTSENRAREMRTLRSAEFTACVDRAGGRNH